MIKTRAAKLLSSNKNLSGHRANFEEYVRKYFDVKLGLDYDARKAREFGRNSL